MKFKEFRKFISQIDRVSICNKEHGGRHRFFCTKKVDKDSCHMV